MKLDNTKDSITKGANGGDGVEELKDDDTAALKPVSLESRYYAEFICTVDSCHIFSLYTSCKILTYHLAIL